MSIRRFRPNQSSLIRGHPRTAIWVAEQITGAKFTVQEDESGLTTIVCDGIGYTSQQQMTINEEVEPGEEA